MKNKISFILVSTVTMLLSCCVSNSADRQAPNVVVIDVSGEIGWSRAPVCYYSKRGINEMQKSIQSIGYEASEVPLFELADNTITSIYELAKGSKPDAKSGRMNFVITCFFSQGPSMTFRMNRNDFKSVLERIPKTASERLKYMYDIVLMYNNP